MHYVIMRLIVRVFDIFSLLYHTHNMIVSCHTCSFKRKTNKTLLRGKFSLLVHGRSDTSDATIDTTTDATTHYNSIQISLFNCQNSSFHSLFLPFLRFREVYLDLN